MLFYIYLKNNNNNNNKKKININIKIPMNWYENIYIYYLFSNVHVNSIAIVIKRNAFSYEL